MTKEEKEKRERYLANLASILQHKKKNWFNAFAGRHIRQNTAKLGMIRRRDRRLERLGLSLGLFDS